ncbi:MAG: ROK family protein, partial [Planctomycetota bacterium]
MAYYLGVDIGGTTSTLCIGDDKRAVRHISNQFATAAAEGPAAVITAIVEASRQAVEQVGGSLADVPRVGLATPGPASHDGVLHKTPNLNPELWDQFPIRGELEKALREHNPELTVRYIGDGQAAALGEFAVRSRSVALDTVSPATLPDEEPTSLFMVIVGTGLGGGAVRDGKPIRGRDGRAGHVGHILLPEDAFRHEHDRHLRVGNALSTAESAVSLTALTHQLGYRLTLPEWSDHPLAAAPGADKDKAKQLRELAADGDALALELFDDQAKALGVALLCVNYLGDFDRIVIGGGVADLAPEVRERYRRHAEQAYHDHALDGFRNLDQFEF